LAGAAPPGGAGTLQRRLIMDSLAVQEPLTTLPARRRWHAPTLTAVFFVLTFIQVWHHTMWRDEIRPWQIVSECHSIGQVLPAMRYDGVPVLWNWLVFLLTRITSQPFSLQLVHLLIATTTVYLVARFAPFPFVAKVLFAFGYFPFFEYATISRNYALVFLLVIVACILISRPRVPIIWLATAMFALTQTSIWGAGFASLFTATAAAKALAGASELRPRLWRIATAGFIVAVGVALCAIEIPPGPGPSFTGSWAHVSAKVRALAMFAAVFRGWVPIPQISTNFWNTSILDLTNVIVEKLTDEVAATYLLQGVIGLPLLIAVLAMFLPRPIPFVVLFMGSAALLGFEFVFRGAPRHHGHLFMLLVAASWLTYSTSPFLGRGEGARRWLARLDRMRPVAFMILLALGTVGGISAAVQGMCHPFSQSRATADFIRGNFPADTPVIGVIDYSAAPVSQWLGRPIFYPQELRVATYNTQNDAERNPELNIPDVTSLILSYAAYTGRPTIFIFTSGFVLKSRETSMDVLKGNEVQTYRFSEVGRFEGGVVSDENMVVYLITRVQPSGVWHVQ
jgi:hypothetical protein